MFKILFLEEGLGMQFFILIKLSILFQNKCIGSVFSCSLQIFFFVSHLFRKVLMRVTLGVRSSLYLDSFYSYSKEFRSIKKCS